MRLRNRLASIVVKANKNMFDNMTNFDIQQMDAQERDTFQSKLVNYIKDYMKGRGVPSGLIVNEDVMELMNDVLYRLTIYPFDPSKGVKFTTYLTDVIKKNWKNKIDADNAQKRVLNKDTVSTTVSIPGKDGKEGDFVENSTLPSTPSFEGDTLNNVLVEKILSELTDKEKEAFVLVRFEGYSLRDAANKMNSNQQTIKNIVDRAMAKLQNIISPDDLR
jgi:hypothetical protein